MQRARAVALILGSAVPITGNAQQPVPSTPLVFDRVTVVDVEHGALVPNQRVVIVGNRIATMGEVGAVNLPRGAAIVDARDKYLIPGLWDMHVHPMHQADLAYSLFLANGVTGIRDAASAVPLDSLIRWRQMVLSGALVGPPRQILSGKSIDQMPLCQRERSDPHPCAPDLPDDASSSSLLDAIQGAAAGVASQILSDSLVKHHVRVADADSAGARRLVDSLKTAGADMIKTYDLSRAMYFVIAAEARRIGIPFGGHLGWATAIEASDSGARILDHVNASGDLDAVCVLKEEQPIATGTAFALRPKLPVVIGASVDRCRPVAERFARNGTWFVPTMLVLASSFPDAPGLKAVGARLERYARDFFQGSVINPYALDQRGDKPAYSTSSAPDSLGTLFIVQKAGLPILAGTDAGFLEANQFNPAGFSLHAELAAYAAEGITPLNALQSATLNPAKLLHATDSLGTVAPGKLADLVLLDANPLADIANTTSIRAVVANGRYFDRAALDRVLADAQAKAKARFTP